MKIIYAPKAKKSIGNIANYIENKGYPETAENFINKLYDFGSSLNIFPEVYPICRQKYLSGKNMRCAIFHKNYIFVYKATDNILIIYNIIHVKTNPVRYRV